LSSFIRGSFEGAKPLQNLHLPLSFEGEGDKGGEVDRQFQYSPLLSTSYFLIMSSVKV
jgi:hypothetical protein